ncbi:MAG: hypothetical protein Q8K79_03300 [Solirubrobacteraceae bacterium]|nr:hypothetical protein [Solirubrobacteraceae bacterium]
MPAGSIRTPDDARTIEAGMLLIGAGALLLLVSLFLEWFDPGLEAWDVFEVWDLVLAALAIVALVAVASRMGFGAPRPASWLIGPAIAALVIVLYTLIDPPPVLAEGDPSTGLWLALAAAILMTAGAVLSVARISVAINPADSLGGGHGRPGGRFGRSDPADPVAGDPVDRGPVGPGPGGPGPGPGPDPGGPGRPGGTPPTEPTRRI